MAGSFVQHVGYYGMTRHGKTEACMARNCPRMLERNHPAFLWIDPTGAATNKIGTYLTLHGRPFIYHAINETKNVPGYDFCPRSENPDPDQKEAENRETISSVISVLMRREGQLDASKTQFIQLGLTDALNLLIHQTTPVPFYFLRHAFVPESEEGKWLRDNCTDPETSFRFMYYDGLKGQQRAVEIGPAERRLRFLCSSPQFRKVCQPTFDLAAFYNAGGNLLVDGKSLMNLSREDSAAIMGMIILLTIGLARSGRLTRRIVIVVDEGLNTGLLQDGNITRALRQAGQWGGGVEFHLMIQDETYLEPEIQASLGMLDIEYRFKMGTADAARVAAEKCGVMTLDPMMIKEVITRFRMEHTGKFEIEHIEHESKQLDDHHKVVRRGVSEGHILKPIYTERQDDTTVRYSLEEQIVLMQKKFLLLKVGHCIIKEGVVVLESNGPLPMLKMPAMANAPWQLSPRVTLGERKFAKYLESLKTTPPYQTPEPFVCTPPKITRKTGME